MIIKEIFSRLSYGELSNLSIGNDGNGTIDESEYPKLINYINEGLIRLFTRFILREKTVIIEQVGHITNYHLDRRFAESTGSDENYLYIKDLMADPFEDDVVRILEVWDHFGRNLPLNDAQNRHSLFTPQPTMLQVPEPEHGEPFSIVYQAKHPVLQTAGNGLLNQEIELPYFFESALQSFIAHKVFSHMNGQENTIISQEHLATYEATCLEAELKDLAHQTFYTSHSKLEDRGFV